MLEEVRESGSVWDFRERWRSEKIGPRGEKQNWERERAGYNDQSKRMSHDGSRGANFFMTEMGK